MIVRDVRARLPELKKRHAWASWQFALSASIAEHPDWYRHYQPSIAQQVEPLLRAAGIDMAEPELPGKFIGNVLLD